MKHQGNPNVQLSSRSASSTMEAGFSVEQVSHPSDQDPRNAENVFTNPNKSCHEKTCFLHM